jgi:hypothetical protein
MSGIVLGNITMDNITFQPKVFVFTTITSTQAFTVPAGVTSINVLLVGGGGAGGSGWQGGGGGGGGFVEDTLAVTPGTSYTITIGAGGTAGFTSARTGSNSTIAFTSNSTVVLTAIGGGAGTGETITANTTNSIGSAGGSGGAGCHPVFANGVSSFNTGLNVVGFSSTQNSTMGYGIGFSGGNGRAQQNGTYGGVSCNDYILVGGGGGGAGGVGQTWSLTSASGTLRGGNGAPGLQSSLLGTATFYAAGGGGGLRPVNGSLASYIPGVGGTGGGGNASTTPTAGTVNSGSGGGGMSRVNNSFGGNAGSGGSGICVIRYSQ